MITDGKKWHYLAVEKTACITQRGKSKNVGDFYYLNRFHSYSTEKKT